MSVWPIWERLKRDQLVTVLLLYRIAHTYTAAEGIEKASQGEELLW